MTNTINSLSSEVEQKKRPTAKSAIAAAVVSAAALAACGGGNDCDDNCGKPPVNPDVPPVPQNIEKDYAVPDVVGKTPITITVAPAQVGLNSLDGFYVATSGKNVDCVNVPDASGTPKVQVNVRPEGIGTEGTDTCVAKATTPGEAKDPDNVTLNMGIDYDAKAPDVQNTKFTLNGGNINDYKTWDIKKELGNITDKSAFTINIPKGQLPGGYTFTYTPATEGKEATATLTAVYPAASTSFTGSVTDALGNATPFSVSVTRVDNTPPPTEPPPTQPTCPPGYVPTPSGACI